MKCFDGPHIRRCLLYIRLRKERKEGRREEEEGKCNSRAAAAAAAATGVCYYDRSIDRSIESELQLQPLPHWRVGDGGTIKAFPSGVQTKVE